MYYSGHGAMHFVEVGDGNTLEKIILIDAGKTSDGTGEAADASAGEVLKRLCHPAAACGIIVCVTHMHADHYSYIAGMLKRLRERGLSDRVEKVYFGSQGWDVFRTEGDAKTIKYWLDDWGQAGRAEFLNPVTSETVLWSSPDGRRSLSVLLNRIIDSGDENARSAVYFVKDSDYKQGILFTGDISGVTMELVRTSPAICGALKTALQGYYLYMTIPHHGSIHSLEEGNFAVDIIPNLGKRYTDVRIRDLLNKIGVTSFDMMISSGVDDEHGHPDMWTVNAFGNYVGRSSWVDEYFQVFRGGDYEELPPDVCESTRHGFMYHNRKKIYSTVCNEDISAPLSVRTEKITIP